MLAKILDYQFRLNGAAIDRSGQNNHGTNTATVFRVGAGSDSAVGFISQHSRIEVPHNSAWDIMSAVKIEVRVFVDELLHRMNLVEASLSLALFVRSDGVVTFTYYAPDDDNSEDPSPVDSFTATPPPSGSHDPFDTLTSNQPVPKVEPNFTWQGVNTDASFSPDGQKRVVTPGQYVTITAIHDGIATMRIFLDGELAGARYDVKHPVLPLLPPGIVAVGAWPHNGRYTLKGAMDYLRIWRYDPRASARKFFCRPLSKDASVCWRQILEEIVLSLESDAQRDKVIQLADCINTAQRRLYQKAFFKGENSLKTGRGILSAFLQLWCSGDVAGESMRQLICRWRVWLERHAPGELEVYLETLRRCLDELRSGVRCLVQTDPGAFDTNWSEFLSVIAKGCDDPALSDPTDPCPPENPRDSDDGDVYHYERSAQKREDKADGSKH